MLTPTLHNAKIEQCGCSASRLCESSARNHPDALEPLLACYRAALRADWASIVDVRREIPHADFADPHTIFNIGGNKYRLLAVIHYARRRVYIKAIQTHAEYGRRN